MTRKPRERGHWHRAGAAGPGPAGGGPGRGRRQTAGRGCGRTLCPGGGNRAGLLGRGLYDALPAERRDVSAGLLAADWHGENPLLDAWCKAQDGKDRWAGVRSRDLMAAMFSWAVPSETALALVARYSPLVEIGAGTGYWAHLLRERGADVVAYDIAPPATHENHYHSKRECFFPVQLGSDASVAGHHDRTLFLCWPPYEDPMAAPISTRGE